MNRGDLGLAKERLDRIDPNFQDTSGGTARSFPESFVRCGQSKPEQAPNPRRVL